MSRIVFMGTPQFSVGVLNGLVNAGYEVVAAVTQPDRIVGRKRIMTPPPVKEAALALGIRVFQPESIGQSRELEEIMALAPDMIITAAFGQFLPEKLLQLPSFGALNVHASLLPKYRGGAPVHYAIMNGETQTGVSIMEMVKKMDAGAILAQKSLPIGKTDDVGTMFTKLSELGTDLLLEMLPDYLAGRITPVPQIDAEATYAPNITREQEEINWQDCAEKIDCQVRGMHPWPVAYTTYAGQRWKIFKVTVLAEQSDKAPGVIVEKSKQQLKIACGGGTMLAIELLQPAGKSVQEVRAFLNGAGSKVIQGKVLGEVDE